MTTFLFLRITHDLSYESGDARRAAHSSEQSWPRCRFLLLAQVFPTAIPRLPRHPAMVAAFPRNQEEGSVPIDVHGSLDRAKDVSSSVSMLFGHRRVERMRLAHADDVPLLILPEDTRCRRCDRLHGNEPRYRRFGPTEAHVLPPTREGRRRRVNQDAFHRCERGSMKRIAPPGTRAGLPLTPPTRYPHGWGQCAHRALQARRMCMM